MAARISIVAALGKNRAIGKGNQLLWHIPDDLKRFKALTLGHPVIMGRKTFESILSSLGKPLPGRTNIVVTRDPDYATNAKSDFDINQVVVALSLEEALEKAKQIDQEEIFIGGGAQIYEQALPHIDRLYITLIDANPPAGGEGEFVYFPEYEKDFTEVLSEEEREYEGISYRWLDLER